MLERSYMVLIVNILWDEWLFGGNYRAYVISSIKRVMDHCVPNDCPIFHMIINLKVWSILYQIIQCYILFSEFKDECIVPVVYNLVLRLFISVIYHLFKDECIVSVVYNQFYAFFIFVIYLFLL